MYFPVCYFSHEDSLEGDPGHEQLVPPGGTRCPGARGAGERLFVFLTLYVFDF